MDSIIRRKHVVAAMLTVAALVASGCSTASRGGINGGAIWPRTQAEEIRKAGDRLGVPVETENMVSFAQSGTTFTTATARAWRTTAATELPRGINFAVAYLDSPGQRFSPGFYTLRAFAEPHGVGTVAGRIQVINAAGEVAGEVPATIDVRSLTVPPEAAITAPTIAVVGVPVPAAVDPTKCKYGNKICYCCTNGTLICTDGLVGPLDINNQVD
jgi:hypothetical protein